MVCNPWQSSQSPAGKTMLVEPGAGSISRRITFKIIIALNIKFLLINLGPLNHDHHGHDDHHDLHHLDLHSMSICSPHSAQQASASKAPCWLIWLCPARQGFHQLSAIIINFIHNYLSREFKRFTFKRISITSFLIVVRPFSCLTPWSGQTWRWDLGSKVRI